MKEYTTCVILASIFLIWWVQPSTAQYGFGARPIAPINCRGARCPGGEVTDPPEDEDEQSEGTAANKADNKAPPSTAAPAPEASPSAETSPAAETSAAAEEATTAAPAPAKR